MLKVGNFELKFVHTRPVSSEKVWVRVDGTDVEVLVNMNGQDGSTICTIMNQDQQVVGVGEAICHADDPFNRAYGRKLAFQRAVEDLTDDKELRTYLWNYMKEASPKTVTARI